MKKSMDKRNWWVILFVGAILSFALVLIQQQWLPDLEFVSFILIDVLLSGAFYWVYALDTKAFWWAQIPALAMAALLVTACVAYLAPKDASGSSPYGVITLGVCSVVMGIVLKKPAVKMVMFCIAIITLLVGILMLPSGLFWKITLVMVEILVVGILALRLYRQLPKSGTRL